MRHMDNDKIKAKILSLDRSKIRFVILFGSAAKGTDGPLSDTDIAVYYEGNPKERFTFRIKVLGHLPDKVDLHIFQDLPLAVQNEVIKGKVLYYDNYQFVFDEFMKVIKSFSSFEKYYNEYFAAMEA
ncbi:nucleotidyltransferase [Candidatus Woesearchaeota archaeon CG10_big_fil_rev_8_21_14_0_10_45_16]|nr:MAG: nucleotidyltransferase [Candidatus Woesearchaeota archaeon CG10_big_fil_rev_8_21_14_0_10_45_16]